MNPLTSVVPYQKGSIAQVANNDPKQMMKILANAKGVVVCDVSGSMGQTDAGPEGTMTRYEVLQHVLSKAQADAPGQLLIYAFNSESHGIIPTGILPPPGGGTPFWDAFEDIYPKSQMMKQKIMVLSDGEPTDGKEEMCIALAEQKKWPITCIYVGGLGDVLGGKGFLKRLAAASGGSMDNVSLTKPHLLTEAIKVMLLTDKVGA